MIHEIGRLNKNNILEKGKMPRKCILRIFWNAIKIKRGKSMKIAQAKTSLLLTDSKNGLNHWHLGSYIVTLFVFLFSTKNTEFSVIHSMTCFMS